MGKKRDLTVNAETLALDLLACKKVFDNVKIPWIIMGGVVLGYARYRKIMEWDTDIDIAVFAEINKSKWKELYKAFCEEGFRVRKHKSDFVCGGRLTPFNLWFFHTNGKFCEAFPKTTPGLKFVEKSMWYKKPQIVDFLNDKYPMPNYMDDYLICQYGPDWMTNVVKDHEKYYLDKRGTRDVSQWPSGRATKGGDMWPKILKIGDNM